MRHASYLKVVFNTKRRKFAVSELVKEIRKDNKSGKFSAIACSGVSGLSIAAIVSYRTGIPLIVVRKGENRHSDFDVEFPDEDLKLKNYIIIDDLISSGATVRRIQESINKDLEKMGFDYVSCVHIYLYQEESTTHHNNIPVTSIGNRYPCE